VSPVGVVHQDKVFFYDVLTTHVGRKSYITNSLILGVPERVVKEVSGHKDEKSFNRYVKLADKYKSQVIRKAYSKENIQRILEL
jgi:integrase